MRTTTTRRTRTATRFAPGTLVTICAAGVVLAAGLSGCGSQVRHDSVHAPALRGNLTPELGSTSQTHDNISNTLAITNDTNLRQMVEDLGSVWYTDRPTRLHRGVSPR